MSDTQPPAGPAPEREAELEWLADAMEQCWGTPTSDQGCAAAVALREYAQLLRDTRPRFDGGARSQEDENDRCAPLVEFVQRRIDRCQHCDGRGERAEEADYTGRIRYEDCIWCAGAREAMRAHRERSGDGA